MTEWDVFISHASEDKSAVVLPLVEALEQAGLQVWVDAQELILGDSLRRKIDEGLARSRFGVVVLSPAFFRKEWPQRELDAILALETQHGKRILPVLHGLEFRSLAATAPLLADKVGVSTSNGILTVAREILRAVGRPVTETGQGRDPFTNAQDFVGKTLGGYAIESSVGKGGSGIVFRSSRPGHRQPVAMKLFYPLRQGYEHLIALFQRGFRAVQAVRHPNVVTVIDSGYVDLDARRTTYLVTEFVDGTPLDEWEPASTTDNGSYLERLRVSCDLASALATCHATSFVDEFGFQVRGVLHGDIKPANILVDRNGSPRLIDFLQVDVQRLIDPRVVAPQILEPRAVTGACGTPGFMAPEQERHGVVTETTDIFGLGITLAVLFGAPGDSWNPILALMQNASISDELKFAILAMISSEPAKRPSTMLDVQRSLAAIHAAEERRLTSQ